MQLEHFFSQLPVVFIFCVAAILAITQYVPSMVNESPMLIPMLFAVSIISMGVSFAYESVTILFLRSSTLNIEKGGIRTYGLGVLFHLLAVVILCYAYLYIYPKSQYEAMVQTGGWMMVGIFIALVIALTLYSMFDFLTAPRPPPKRKGEEQAKQGAPSAAQAQSAPQSVQAQSPTAQAQNIPQAQPSQPQANVAPAPNAPEQAATPAEAQQPPA